MKLYTKTGDKGQTSIVGGRVSKHHLLIDVLGTLDELNSFTGVARTELVHPSQKAIKEELLIIQHELFDCGSDLSTLKPIQEEDRKLTLEMVRSLEARIDAWVKQAPPIKRFILPGGSKASAALHVCRTVTRRTERVLSKLQSEEVMVSSEIQAYVNRLSDYFFAVARAANHFESEADVEYIRGASVFSFSDDQDIK